MHYVQHISCVWQIFPKDKNGFNYQIMEFILSHVNHKDHQCLTHQSIHQYYVPSPMSYTSEYTPILCPITNVLHIRVYTNIMSHHQCLTHQSIHQYYVPSPLINKWASKSHILKTFLILKHLLKWNLKSIDCSAFEKMLNPNLVNTVTEIFWKVYTNIMSHHQCLTHQSNNPKKYRLFCVWENAESKPCKYCDWNILERQQPCTNNPEPGFSMSYVIVFFVFNDLRREVISFALLVLVELSAIIV